MSPLNAAICTTISYTLWVEWYYLKNNYLTLRSKSHEGHYSMWHTALWSCIHIPIIIDISGKTKMLWSGQENTIYLTLRSKVKVPRRSLRYATHSLIPHTKYNWPIWKDKKSYVPDKFRWEEAEVEEKIRLKQYVSLRSKGRHNYSFSNDIHLW